MTPGMDWLRILEVAAVPIAFALGHWLGYRRGVARGQIEKYVHLMATYSDWQAKGRHRK